MLDRDTWDWSPGKRSVADLQKLGEQYDDIHELVVSPDGERIAAPAVSGPDSFRVLVNGVPWEGEFEKAWHLTFAPDGRLIALVRIDDEWTVAVDGAAWEDRWEFAWIQEI